MPPEAQNPDAVGAGAFVRHWFDLANYAYATGDTDELASISGEDCASCSTVIQSISDRYEDGGSYEGGEVTIVGAEAAPPEDGVALVSTVYTQSEIRSLDTDDEVVGTTAAQPNTTVGAVVTFTDGAWRLAGFGS